MNELRIESGAQWADYCRHEGSGSVVWWQKSAGQDGGAHGLRMGAERVPVGQRDLSRLRGQKLEKSLAGLGGWRRCYVGQLSIIIDEKKPTQMVSLIDGAVAVQRQVRYSVLAPF